MADAPSAPAHEAQAAAASLVPGVQQGEQPEQAQDLARPLRLIDGAQRFDMGALRTALLDAGYPEEKQELRGQFTTGLRPALVEQIALPQDYDGDDGGDHAQVTFNLGLCAAQNVLSPELQHQAARSAWLRDLLAVLEHPLLAQRMACQYPERDERLVPDYAGLRRGLLLLLRPHTPAGLQWLFRLIYPEFGVQVARDRCGEEVRSPGVVLCESALGEGALGGEARVPVRGFIVTLFVDEFLGDRDARGAAAKDQPGDYGSLIWDRLRAQVAPLLAETGLSLTLRLSRPPLGLRLSHRALGWEPIAPSSANAIILTTIYQGSLRDLC